MEHARSRAIQVLHNDCDCPGRLPVPTLFSSLLPEQAANTSKSENLKRSQVIEQC
jgi:hypothetical protein